MCLITSRRKRIAKKDMIVYKVMDKRYYSPVTNRLSPSSLNSSKCYLVTPYRCFQYEEGKLYKINIELYPFYSGHFDDKSMLFNSILGSKRARKLENFLYDVGINKSYGIGYHFATTKERLADLKHEIFEFTIPKGSEYILDYSGLGITNQIILNKGQI